MSRKDEAAKLLIAGNSPRQIASLMRITIPSVEQYLYTKVGEGAIRRSDILFSIDEGIRNAVENIILKTGKKDCYSVFRAAKRQGHSLDYKELEIYLKLRDARISLGDMYEFIYQIETALHELIKRTLVEKYGGGENGWWRKGISLEIRKDCTRLREEETEPAAEPFCYTTFIHLKKIVDDQWTVFSRVLPQAVVKDKKKFLSNLNKLNSIRNYVMHPVKGMPITDDDFAFVREFHRSIKENN
jgi:predicted transcriptional regulator